MNRFLWTQQSNFGPSDRGVGAMAYDSVRGRVVLFGGRSSTGQIFGDTWEWDGSFWTQVEDIGPSPRFASAMVYDTARRVCLLFGGRDKDNQFLADTWQWDGSKWTKLSESGPSSRSNHAMAYDNNRGRTVLFGGYPPDTPLGDTWEFDGDTWTQQQDAGPLARSRHGMAFDDAGARTILFGGLALDGSSPEDTWSWDGNDWVQIAEFGPSPRFEAALASTQDGSLILYGGVDNVVQGKPAILADTWEFDGKRWTQRQDIGPGPLREATIAFDSLRGRVVLFGGQTPAPDGTTWELPAAPIHIASLQIDSHIPSGNNRPLTVVLSRPTSATGAVITFSGPIFTPQGADLGPITLEPGIKSKVIPVGFAHAVTPTTVTFSVAIEGTPPVSATVIVDP